MYPTEEQFDDFKMAEAASKMDFAVTTCDHKWGCRVFSMQRESLDEILGMADKFKDKQGYLKSQIATSSWMKTRKLSYATMHRSVLKSETRASGWLHFGERVSSHLFNVNCIMLQKRQKFNLKRLSCYKKEFSLT